MAVNNPFTATRAVDFTDVQISRQWVELPGEGGVSALAKPLSELPMLILGGKGSGKTHLMRYLSTGVRLASGEKPESILESRYLGVYLRCTGINAARFGEKGQDPKKWLEVFGYHLDLTLAEECLRTSINLLRHADIAMTSDQELRVVQEIVDIFDSWNDPLPQSVDELISALALVRRRVDMDVNNCSRTRPLTTVILSSPAQLVFGVPKVLSGLDAFRRTLFVFLIDEVENLSESKQLYVNSLVRDNRPPCSIKVGARLHGFKTKNTLSDQEELKVGSEYEPLMLDEELRSFRSTGQGKYVSFISDLCMRRLSSAGFSVPTAESGEAWLERQLASEESSQFGQLETDFVLQLERKSKNGSTERPWIRKLRSNLEAGLSRGYCRGSITDVDPIVDSIRCAAYPLVERYNVHALYQRWANVDHLLSEALRIKQECSEVLGGKTHCSYKDSLDSWRVDLLAQIRRDYAREQLYVGFKSLVTMTFGFPRHLLVLLKHIYDVSEFRGERPFIGGQISVESQRVGVRRASEWFFGDARMTGAAGDHLQTSVSRIAQLMRAVRFADKPAEVSVCAFSVDLNQVSSATRACIESAEKWSLVSRCDGGRKEKNSYRVDAQYQVNPLLAPRWDLPIAIRGVLAISPAEANVLFSSDSQEDEVKKLIQRKTSRMNGPHFSAKQSPQPSLFDVSDDES